MVSGLVRIVLAMLVVVHHLSRLGIGKTCVYLFFMLSGYWVARMWEEKYSRLDHSWRQFVTARFLRIWPLFLICNVAAMLMFAAIGHPVPVTCGDGPSFGCLQALLGNSSMLFYGQMPERALGPAWSLDIELQFYLIAPLLIAALAGRTGWLLATCVALLGVALLAVWFLPETLPQYLPFFVAGILTAEGRIRVERPMATASAVATTILVALAVLTAPGREVLFTGASPTGLAQYNEAFNVLLAILAGPGVVYLATRERGSRGAALGDIAFSIYIVHWIPVSYVNLTWGHLPSMQRLPYVVGAIVATVLMAVVLWKWVDQPLERWRRGLARRATEPRRVA